MIEAAAVHAGADERVERVGGRRAVDGAQPLRLADERGQRDGAPLSGAMARAEAAGG